MRFQNLTITLTLACLSIVAIVVLALLPIIDGVCDFNSGSDSWSYYDDYNEDNDSYQLSAYANARGVDAGGGVSVHSLGRYTRNYHEQGTVSVTAGRTGFNYRHESWEWGKCFDIRNSGTCPGHDIPGDADSNVKNTDGYESGRHTDITLRIQMAPKVDTNVEVYGEEESTSYQLTMKGIWQDIEAEANFTYQGKKYKAKTQSQKVSYTEAEELISSSIPTSWSASVGFDSRTNSSASVDATFRELSAPKTVSYTP